jgi:hypothetical protein
MEQIAFRGAPAPARIRLQSRTPPAGGRRGQTSVRQRGSWGSSRGSLTNASRTAAFLVNQSAQKQSPAEVRCGALTINHHASHIRAVNALSAAAFPLLVSEAERIRLWVEFLLAP